MRGKDGAQPRWQGFIGLKLGLHLWSKQDGMRCTMFKSNVENGCCNLLSGEHDPAMAGCVDVAGGFHGGVPARKDLETQLLHQECSVRKELYGDNKFGDKDGLRSSSRNHELCSFNCSATFDCSG